MGATENNQAAVDGCAAFSAMDAEAAMRDISDAIEWVVGGVTPEQYSDPVPTDEKGLARMGEYVGASIKDPDGSVLAIGSG